MIPHTIRHRLVFLTVLALVAVACGDGDSSRRAATPTAASTPTTSPSPTPTTTPAPVAGDPLSGGEGTVFITTRDAFGQPARNLPLDQRTDFFVGNALFRRDWVTAPSSTEGSDGLGPVFNAPSCSSCHLFDGRGRPPVEENEAFVGVLFRLSVPGVRGDGGPVPDPNYGDQLNPRGILGVPGEGRPSVIYTEIAGRYGDGEPYSLRMPTYAFTNLAFGPLDSSIQVSPRSAPFLIGLGLLAAVDEADIVAAADRDDVDGNGISGRPNWVWDVRQQAPALGRFGWKANQPTVEQQNAGAFVGDMGLTSPLFPTENCTAVQIDCQDAPNGGDPELDQQKIDLVTFYARYLGVPARRDVDDPTVQRGEKLFAASGCASCHTPTFTTGTVDDAPALSAQRIHPYTDLLLHDLGDGLADGRPDFGADGREWRTPPLWGIGLVQTVNRHTLLLHDGRARGFAEAILWHGGEASAAAEAFRTLDADDRAALVRFLGSL